MRKIKVNSALKSDATFYMGSMWGRLTDSLIYKEAKVNFHVSWHIFQGGLLTGADTGFKWGGGKIF